MNLERIHGEDERDEKYHQCEAKDAYQANE